MATVAVVLGLAALGFVGFPLLRSREEPVPEPVDEHGRPLLLARKETIYENIRDLDFEHAMGKLTESDYREIRQDLMKDAASVLKELDGTSRDQALERWIEAEVKERRARLAATRTCAACGAPERLEAKFCSACGAKL